VDDRGHGYQLGKPSRPRYRWNWSPRAVGGTANNFADVIALAEAADHPNPDTFQAGLEEQADTDQWLRTFAIEHAVGNWDSFGNRNARNWSIRVPLAARDNSLIVRGYDGGGLPVPSAVATLTAHVTGELESPAGRVVINEIMYRPLAPNAEYDNAGANRVALDDYSLASDAANLRQWPFPTGAAILPGQYLLVWLDGALAETTATEWHAGFQPPRTNGIVILSRVASRAGWGVGRCGCFRTPIHGHQPRPKPSRGTRLYEYPNARQSEYR
jgi:hypothetical protein